MSPVPLSRSWMPGAALLAGVLAATILGGMALGLTAWILYLGLGLTLLLSAGWVERLWTLRREPPPPRIRGKLRVIQGGKVDPYDLAKDKTTDSQRYLM